MKLSVSLPDEDVQFIDSYAAGTGTESRSAVLQKAIRLLRAADLGDAYEDAWTDWASSGDAAVWDVTSADGVADAAR